MTRLPTRAAALFFAALLALAVGIAFPAAARALPGAASDGTVTLDGDYTWGAGPRDCINPPDGYVVCIMSSRQVPGFGTFEYARYAENVGEMTKDGCAELSSHGTIWVPGGTAEFDGKPAPTCGKGHGMGTPDANYLYTIEKGTGVLAGATGSGQIVADHGVDIWKGTVVAPKLKGVTVPLAFAAATPSASPSVSSAATSAAASSSASAPAASVGAAATAVASPSDVASGAAAPLTKTVASSSSATLPIVAGILVLIAVALGVVLARRRKGSSL